MPIDTLSLIAIAVAAVLALALDAITSRRPIPWPAAGPATLLVAAAAIAIALAHTAFNNAQWLLPALLAAAGVLGAALPRLGQPWTRLALALVLAPIGCWLILNRISSYHDRLATLVEISGGITAFCVLLWEAVPTLVGPAAGRLVLGGTAAFCSLCMLLSNCFTIGGYSLVIPAAILAPLLFAFWRTPAAEGLGLAAALECGWAWTLMYATTEVVFPATWATLALLAVTPAAALLARIPALRPRPWTAAILVVAVAVMIAGAGAFWTWRYCQPDAGLGY